jgi:L-cystine uptake protein TcyP (sodium:dicarboxylate symporter family)
MISDWKTILMMVVLVGTFAIIKACEKKNISFTKRTIIATTIGLAIGVVVQLAAGTPDDPSKVAWMAETSKWYHLFGSGFMSILKMIVVPMVFVSILRVIISMAEGEDLSSLTFKSLGTIMSMTAIAGVVGIVVGKAMGLGLGYQTVYDKATNINEIQPIVDTFLALLPSNPIEAMATTNVVGVIIFAAFLGIAIRRQNKKYREVIKPFVDLVEATYKIIMSVAMTIIKLMPYAIVAMLATTIIDNGIATLMPVLEFIVAIYIAIIIMFAIELVALAVFGLNPITYIKKVTDPLLLGFTSRSTLGTLPVSIKTMTNKLGLEENLGSFVGGLGANIGLAACAAIFPALVCVMITNMVGIQMDATFYAMLFVVIAISAFGIAGIPGTATVAVSVVLSAMGMGDYFPLIGAILAVDPIIDMGRTLLNVNSGIVESLIVGKLTGKIDMKVYNEPVKVDELDVVKNA